MLARIESTRGCRASCVTVARSAVVSGELVAVMGWSSEVGVHVAFAPGGFEETACRGGGNTPRRSVDVRLGLTAWSVAERPTVAEIKSGEAATRFGRKVDRAPHRCGCIVNEFLRAVAEAIVRPGRAMSNSPIEKGSNGPQWILSVRDASVARHDLLGECLQEQLLLGPSVLGVVEDSGRSARNRSP